MCGSCRVESNDIDLISNQFLRRNIQHEILTDATFKLDLDTVVVSGVRIFVSDHITLDVVDTVWRLRGVIGTVSCRTMYVENSPLRCPILSVVEILIVVVDRSIAV